MRSLRKFITISLICHAGLILALVDVQFSGKLSDTSEVYEVSIVAGMPAAAAGASQNASVPQGKKFIAPRKAEKVSLGEPLYSVLLYVHTENKRRKTPSFKSITKKFQITKTTARKRIYELESKGLLKIQNQGRYKFLEVTDKGKTVVSSPASLQGGEENEEN